MDSVANGLLSSGDGSLAASMLCWLSASSWPSGRGGARRLTELLAGVWSTMIKAGRYRAGWTRLSVGRRKRRVAALVAGTGMGSLGHGASSGVASYGHGRGPDDRLVDATLLCFGGGRGSLLPPPVNCRDP